MSDTLADVPGDSPRDMNPSSPEETVPHPTAPQQTQPPTFRLSMSQEQLWFLDQLFPGSPAYNVGLAFRLRGQLNVQALSGAVRAVLETHDVLRASFGAVDGEPFQVFAPAPVAGLTVTDLSGADDDAVMEAVAAEADTPFDLAAGPLYRFRLLRLADDEHLLLIVIHHILTDGWSMGIITKQLTDCYRDLAAGSEPAVARPPLNFAEHAQAQRRLLGDGLIEEQLAYWADQLTGLPALELPADRIRPTTLSLRGDLVSVRFPSQLHSALGGLARQTGSGLFTMLVAAVNVVLARYAGQDDIPLGLTMLGRPEPQLEDLVGFFINMVVLRTDMSGNPTFLELLSRVGDGTLDAMSNQDVPFDLVVQRVQPVRDAGRNPLFQVAVQLLGDANSGGGLDLPGIAAEPLRIPSTGSRFDLVLNFVESADSLRLEAEYSTDLFDRSRIEALAWHISNVLAAACEDPGRHLTELPLLSVQESGQLLARGRGAPSSRTPDPVHTHVARRATASPAMVAAVCRGRQLSYGELDRRAAVLARHLRRLGVAHEHIVAVALPRDLDVLVALLGVMKAGAAYTMLDMTHPAARLEYILRDTGARVVLTQSHLCDRLPSAADVTAVRLDTDGELIESAADDALPAVATRDSLVYVLYTSGSSGQPKGVMLEHRALMSFAESYQQTFGLGPGVRMLQLRAHTFDMAHGEIIAGLTAGATLAIVPDEVTSSPEALAELIRSERLHYVGMPPTMLSLVDAGPYPELRSVMSGGEAVAGDLVNKWNLAGRRFVNAYGPTEAAVACTDYECEHRAWQSVPPIGGPYLDRQLYVVDRWDNLVPAGVPGELLVGGAEGLARGYLNRSDLTDEAFVADPFCPGGRVYRTGDLVRWNAEGQLEFLGRRDNQVKLRGMRIEIEEIEAVTVAHPDVAMAAVAIHPDARGEQMLTGYVTADGQRPTAAALREHASRHLPEYMVPQAWLVLDEFPLTPARKIDRAALPAPSPDDEHPHQFTPPSTATETQVSEVLAECLGLGRCGAEDSFFDLGGNSLQAMRAVSRLNRAFAVRVNVRLLYGSATVRAIAAKIDEMIAGQRSAAAPGGGTARAGRAGS
jgi:amino acid adenylation domain-containing protein